jgi:hypothetical protein
MMLTINLITVESVDHKKLPRAARRACLVSFFCHRSPKNAQSNGHTSNHIGGTTKNQIISPKVHHRTQAFVPP